MKENKTVYLNGDYIPLIEAKISVLDRGFLFGDGVYEVIPAYQGHLFHLSDHLQRLEKSLAGIRLKNPYSSEQWLDIFTFLLDRSKNQYIYLQITRGADIKRDHAFPENVSPTVFVMCSDILPFQGKITGIKAVTLPDSRWQFCNLKTIALLANILHRQDAIDQNTAEALLIKDDYVTEGAASNVFIVINGTLITPPKNHLILPGITRDVILTIAQKNHIPYKEENISLSQLKSAEEVWVTSSTREIVPVIEVDGLSVATGCPGSVYQQMDQLFQAYKQSLV